MPDRHDIGPPLPPSRRASLDAVLATAGSSRRSVLLGFSTLLRGRKQADITARELFSEYAGREPLPPVTMQPERPSRAPSKLYTFLTRSRSRSRSSKQDPPQHGTRPPSRIPSRPLSSATSTTVTPKKHLRSPPPADVPPRPSTSGGGARQKLHDLFGIALARRPSRSRSRPPSPSRQPSPSPAPVLRVTNPTTDSTGSTAPSVHTFSSPDPPVLPPIPPLVSRVSSLHRRSTKDPDQSPSPPQIIHTPPTPMRTGPSSGTVTASTSASSSRVPPASTSTSASSIPRQGHAPKGSLDSNFRYRVPGFPMRAVAEEGPAPPSDIAPKGKIREPLPRPLVTKMSSTARATKHGSFDFERPGWSLAIQRSGSGGTTGTSASSRLSGAVPMDSVLRERERESVYGPGMAGVGTLQRDVSMKRAQDREDLLRAQKERGRKTAKKERTRGSSSQRTTPDTVHASTSSASGTQQHSNTNGKSSSMGPAAARRTVPLLPKRLVGIAQLGPFSFEPAVALSSPTRSTGSASTGTAHEVSVPTARAERERARLRDEKARNGGPAKRRSGDRAPVPVPVPVMPPAYAYHSDDGSAPDSPGPIPVPMPLTLSAVLEGTSEQSKLGPPGSLGRTSSSAVRPPRPAPGHRSGTKGRSLDLGLGLAWAPSKVREEALLPKSSFFTRTGSLGSNRDRATGRTRQGSGAATAEGAIERTASGASSLSRLGRNGNDGTAQTERDIERAKLGREVAEVFRTALDGDGYKLFKSYVHQFDAHDIPFDGPLGIVARVEDLLVSSPKRISDSAQKSLMDKFVRIILQVT